MREDLPGKHRDKASDNDMLSTECGLERQQPLADRASLEVDSTSFEGVLHDNLSNKKRQGSGFAPLILKSHPGANLYRDDAVGINFEHIFNGAKEQYDISMFTPRQDPCHLKQVRANRYELHWPSKGSKWGMEARMVYDLSKEDQVDLVFECTPTVDLYSQRFAAMMWASYMHCTHDRKIHFWGTEGDRTGWVAFGEGTGKDFEVGTVSYVAVPNLPYEEEAQTLNLIEHPRKKFITPFYYGLIDGDHDLETISDKLLYLVLFDQTNPIRFAMWNFFTDETGDPASHSPAWDWQYVIRDPEVGQSYGYRARVVVKPFKGAEQIWEEYRRWSEDLGVGLPEPPVTDILR
ncbi:MAG: hypothetical protein QGI86_23220 [Candidatus Poribacteria bacterium]|jgi:hypothetical protein|nr:hypothetical protein [Candidatus Poribacteria bacterium]MDP6745598.1 hypothetical protein [Candidatus Poribacteria bacterium]MDP6997608.1 hypothetical protein [Candidatus Poribacteria bacterium]